MKKSKSVFNNFGNNPKYRSDNRRISPGYFDNDLEFAEEFFNSSYEDNEGYRKKSDSEKAKKNRIEK